MARASHPCPTCTALVPSGGGSHCPTCTSKRRKQSRARNGRDDAHYSTARWRRTRTDVLTRNPVCAVPDCQAPSTVVDHDPPRRQLVTAGIHDPDHPRWLIALCKPHHDRKTATVDGGFGHAPVDRRLEPLNLDGHAE